MGTEKGAAPRNGRGALTKGAPYELNFRGQVSTKQLQRECKQNEDLSLQQEYHCLPKLQPARCQEQPAHCQDGHDTSQSMASF